MKLADFYLNSSIPEHMISYMLDLTKYCCYSELIEVTDPHNLAGPFAENYGLLTVRNYAIRPSPWPLISITAMRELEDKSREKYKAYDYNRYRRKRRHDDVRPDYEYEIADPTIERPVRLRLSGNDDFTWSVCLSTEQEAMNMVDDLIAVAPLSVQEIINYCGMIFTN